MQRRNELFAWLAIAMLACAGWWALRAPAIEHRAVASPPEIDIDPPAMRARREAAIALAMTPDDPWTFAESLAASAPSATPAKEDCGLADAPQFDRPIGGEEARVQIAAASPRFTGAQARVDAALRASADPLDRAVADLLNVGDMRSDAGRDEAVVQQAVSTTDPRVYALAFGICRTARAPASCASISLQRWIELDPGNGMPWMWALSQAQDSGDIPGAVAAISRLASSTRFDVYEGRIVGAVVNHAPKDGPDLAASTELAVQAIGDAAALPLPSFQTLIGVCRNHAGGIEALVQQCRRISDVMFDHTDNLLVQSISGALLFQATGDASRRDAIRAERAIVAARWSPATGFSKCRDMREDLKRLRRAAEIGEVEAMHERARQFVAP
jgi:hypothetical protein